jgi:lipopolysaccharide/colanic/teichoic acid biosynthesis glycosyltransferase
MGSSVSDLLSASSAGVSATARSATKRIVDVLLGSLVLLLISPLLTVVALSILITSPGPVFFRQFRLGLDGTEFQIWKFRTMHHGAEHMRVDLDDANESDGHLFKLAQDPRLTPVGGLLRRWSIDELPQLLNVLTGEMSLVGPRPLPSSDSTYEGEQRRRLSAKPGMTGLWQVSGRSTIGWDEMVRLDLDYIDRWSLWRDFVILVRTAKAVLFGHGAY